MDVPSIKISKTSLSQVSGNLNLKIKDIRIFNKKIF
jgi:hypothetical protein